MQDAILVGSKPGIYAFRTMEKALPGVQSPWEGSVSYLGATFEQDFRFLPGRYGCAIR